MKRVVLTSTVCMYSGAWSDEWTAMSDRKAAASSSEGEKYKGLTSMLFPKRLYTCCMRFSDDGATYMTTGGGLAFFTVETPTYAASHGVEQAPVSPTCSTRPDSGFTSCPKAGHPVTNMFSRMTDTVW